MIRSEGTRCEPGSRAWLSASVGVLSIRRGQVASGGDWHTQASDRSALLGVCGQQGPRSDFPKPARRGERGGGGHSHRFLRQDELSPRRSHRVKTGPWSSLVPRHQGSAVRPGSPRLAGANISRTKSSRLSPGWCRTRPCCGGRRSPPRSAGGSR